MQKKRIMDVCFIDKNEPFLEETFLNLHLQVTENGCFSTLRSVESINFSTLHSEKFIKEESRDSSERSVKEDQFTVACEGKFEIKDPFFVDCEEKCKKTVIASEGKLIFTSICMPSIIFILWYKYNIYNKYFAVITTIGSIVSVLFWIDPITNRGKLIHKLDALIARFVIVNYTIYKLFINRNNLFLFLCNYLFMMYYFYLSNKISSKQWCSTAHINNHVTAHLYCMLCLYISFFKRDFLWEFVSLLPIQKIPQGVA